jgi:hypothetical protein
MEAWQCKLAPIAGASTDLQRLAFEGECSEHFPRTHTSLLQSFFDRKLSWAPNEIRSTEIGHLQCWVDAVSRRLHDAVSHGFAAILASYGG